MTTTTRSARRPRRSRSVGLTTRSAGEARPRSTEALLAPVERERIRERERRWAVPAAVLAFCASLLFLAPLVIQQTAHLYSGSSTAQQLESLHEHASALVIAPVVRALAFLALIGSLLFLFMAAPACNPQVRQRRVAIYFL